MKIVLLGYVASGKSSIGKLMAKKVYHPFIDLDTYIEKKEKMAIKTIFETKGEIYFRKIEHEYLQEILSYKDKFILSLGGGTPCYAGNMDLITQNDTVAVYLQATIGTLKERLLKGKNKRPLIADLTNEKLSEFIAKHLFERRVFYEKAMHKIKIDDKSMEEIVAEIRILLH